ncbi:MAG TPA: hypothetical protein VFF16_02610, partial [Telluria sp.]|nr:hypothetical protein [Telluria sp.]
MLEDVLRAQFERLSAWAALPSQVERRAETAFAALTEGALRRPASPPFDGLSRINASGLPFQWSFSFAPGGARSLRFLCEPGRPGDSAQQRFAFARGCLERALDGLGTPRPQWLEGSVFAHLIPGADAWPEHWRSALWFGVGAAPGGVLIKPYVNLNWGTALERWRRLGRVLRDLDRRAALETLCAFSGQVSRNSWPVGLALDVLPDGHCGRVKIYFRSDAVTPEWLQRWYAAAGAEAQAPLVRAALDAFPYCGQARYPERAFVVSLELGETAVSLKTDFAITRWMRDDAAIAAGTRRLLRRAGAEPEEFDAALRALGAWPPDDGEARVLRFVGLGHEADGSRHVNVYAEPPLAGPTRACVNLNLLAPALAARSGAGVPACAGTTAVLRRGLDFLLARQEDGMWRDYDLPVGVADQWITAYVLWMLADLPRAQLCAPALAGAGAALLRVGAAAGGWGYNAGTGNDADSTSIAILALRAHGIAAPRPAFDFLATCRAADGGMGTYPPGSEPGGSWCHGSCEVSAAALLALGGDAQLAAFLAKTQHEDGLWPSFWWHSLLYPSWLALCAGCRPGAALRHTLARYEPIDAFETALLLLCRDAAGLRDGCAPLARRLAEQ